MEATLRPLYSPYQLNRKLGKPPAVLEIFSQIKSFAAIGKRTTIPCGLVATQTLPTGCWQARSHTLWSRGKTALPKDR
jgi:hypothetical protein